MGEMEKQELERLIRNISKKGSENSKEELDKIVKYIGLEPETTQGQILQHSVGREIKLMKRNKRKTGENYAHHTIFVAKESAKLTTINNAKDITMIIASLFHDDIEESQQYKIGKKAYITNLTRLFLEEQIVTELEKIKRKYVTEIHTFLDQKSKDAPSGLNVGQVCCLVDDLTKKHNEYYHEYLERIFGRKGEKMYKDGFLISRLRMAIIKTAGDRIHNTTTIPREAFTTTKRLKECYKSMMTINRARNLSMDYEEENRNESNGVYFDFLKESEIKLTETTKNLVASDKEYLKNQLIKIIEQDELEIIDGSFRLYTDQKIRKPATEKELDLDPENIFDGTLVRYDDWIRNKYRWGITHSEKISLMPTHKKWMNEYLKIKKPKNRALVQEYMDACVFEKVFERFQQNPEFTLTGYKEINN